MKGKWSVLARCTTLFVLVLLSSYSYAQDKVDSLLIIIQDTNDDSVRMQTYLTLTNLTLGKDPQQSAIYARKTIDYAKKLNHGKNIATALSLLANIKYIHSEHDSAKYYLLEARDVSLEIGDSLRAYNCMQNLAVIFHRTGRLDEAQEITLNNIENFTRLNDSLQIGNAYKMLGNIRLEKAFPNLAMKDFLTAYNFHKDLGNNYLLAEDLFQIGVMYSNNGQYQEAEQNLKKAIELYDNVGRDNNKAQAMAYLASAYLNDNRTEEGKKIVDSALELSRSISYISNIARCFEIRSRYYKKNKQFALAIQEMTASIDFWKQSNGWLNVNESMLDLAELHYLNHDLKQSQRVINEVLENIINSESHIKLAESYLLKSKIENDLGNSDAALMFLQKHVQINDSLFTLEKEKSLQELMIIHEIENKEAQLQIQNKEIQHLEQNLKIKQLQSLIFKGAFILMIIILLLVFYGFRQKFKRTQVEKLKEKELLTKEIEYKKRELASHTLHLVQKNNFLENLKSDLENLKPTEPEANSVISKTIHSINIEYAMEKDWEAFKNYFAEVHSGFEARIKQEFPDVTDNELRLAYCIKMKLNTKEIASLLHIMPESVRKTKYRLKKKMNLDSDVDFDIFLQQL